MKQKNKKHVNKSRRIPVHVYAPYHATLKAIPKINMGAWVDEAIKEKMNRENIKVPE